MTAGWRFALIDVLFILLLVLILLPHNPKIDDESKPPGQVTIEARWADELTSDVDLWVQAPNDRPVGYSNRAGEYFNLLRDDLGVARDHLGLNYEFSYSRGAPPGEYTVNVHMYGPNQDTLPVKVTVRASTTVNGSTIMIFTKVVMLTMRGMEITVARFSLDKNGFLVPNSIHDFPKALRG